MHTGVCAPGASLENCNPQQTIDIPCASAAPFGTRLPVCLQNISYIFIYIGVCPPKTCVRTRIIPSRPSIFHDSMRVSRSTRYSCTYFSERQPHFAYIEVFAHPKHALEPVIPSRPSTFHNSMCASAAPFGTPVPLVYLFITACQPQFAYIQVFAHRKPALEPVISSKPSTFHNSMCSSAAPFGTRVPLY